ncbi:ArgS-related anticodon-binding protein NrtL [Streptomyces sp. MMBL 11-3]|uniref:ArgS-related anticodon-binding protein NrtL n=1 Tax=Streptomyces sp. MMBL 11-3 TaxID=3382639 RepID=UPI0039B650EB
MTPVELSSTVLRAVRRAVDAGELDVGVPERAQVVPPGPGGRGDYATNVALQLARPAGRPPHEVAAILRSHLSTAAGVTRVDVTGPGFLNITLGARQQTLVGAILRDGTRYGYAADGPRYGYVADGATAAPVHLRHPREVRAAVTAEVLARILRSQGFLVHTTEAEAGAGAETTKAEAEDRAGSLIVTLRPVPAPGDPAPLGRDAARWALLHPASHDRPRITDEHLVQREGNPLFRVRYAHARARALTRDAGRLGFTGAPGAAEAGAADGGSALLDTLLDALDTYPHALAAAARHRAPDRLTRHLVTVADALLAFQHTVLPLGDEKPSAAHRSRLALAEAAGTVLAGGLSLLGIDAPEHL